MYGDAFKGLDYILWGFFILLPFAAWKAIDILIWIYQHIRVSIQ